MKKALLLGGAGFIGFNIAKYLGENRDYSITIADNFFRAGGASGTIAKAMSAYDKDFSDAIYGVEEDGRYVTEARLKTMLSKEMNHMEERISREKNPKKLFFSFANTVATIDFAKKYKGHGWVGIRYQTD